LNAYCWICGGVFLAEGSRDLRELYILPTARWLMIGTRFAGYLFVLHPCSLTVKQLLKLAMHATELWHRAFSIPGIGYAEHCFCDGIWGRHDGQVFSHLCAKRAR